MQQLNEETSALVKFAVFKGERVRNDGCLGREGERPALLGPGECHLEMTFESELSDSFLKHYLACTCLQFVGYIL